MGGGGGGALRGDLLRPLRDPLSGDLLRAFRDRLLARFLSADLERFLFLSGIFLDSQLLSLYQP